MLVSPERAERRIMQSTKRPEKKETLACFASLDGVERKKTNAPLSSSCSSLPLFPTPSPHSFPNTRSAWTTRARPRSSTASTWGRPSRPRPRSAATSSASSRPRRVRPRQTEHPRPRLRRASSSRSGTWAGRPTSVLLGRPTTSPRTPRSSSSTAPTGRVSG